MLCFSASVLAYEYTAAWKKSFYDNYKASLFSSLKESLLSQHFSASGVDKYISVMKKRLNRSELEEQTWGCVSGYTPESILTKPEEVREKCFEEWNNNFFIRNNKDALILLRK